MNIKTTRPPKPKEGSTYFDLSHDCFYRYEQGEWKVLNSGTTLPFKAPGASKIIIVESVTLLSFKLFILALSYFAFGLLTGFFVAYKWGMPL